MNNLKELKFMKTYNIAYDGITYFKLKYNEYNLMEDLKQ